MIINSDEIVIHEQPEGASSPYTGEENCRLMVTNSLCDPSDNGEHLIVPEVNFCLVFDSAHQMTVIPLVSVDSMNVKLDTVTLSHEFDFAEQFNEDRIGLLETSMSITQLSIDGEQLFDSTGKIKFVFDLIKRMTVIPLATNPDEIHFLKECSKSSIPKATNSIDDCSVVSDQVFESKGTKYLSLIQHITQQICFSFQEQIL